MMSFSLREKRKFTLLAGLIFFHLVLISLQVPRGDEPTYFERAIFTVFSPVQHGVASFFKSLRGFWNSYFYLREVERQNQRMRDEIFALRQENRLLENILLRLRSEQEIRELLGSVSRSILVGSVIGLDAGEIYKSVILNKGSRDGVKRDMTVLDRRGRLVGRVVSPVSLKQARVQLITDEASGVGVFSEQHRVVGVLAGRGDGTCLMKYVLKTNKDIGAGEQVVTSGFDRLYPSGLPVGRIVSVTEDTTLFKKIIVEPYFDFSELDEVAILTVDPSELAREKRGDEKLF